MAMGRLSPAAVRSSGSVFESCPNLQITAARNDRLMSDGCFAIIQPTFASADPNARFWAGPRHSRGIG